MRHINRWAYRPEEDLFGVTTVVTDKSKDGLPNEMGREREINLPPGAATPRTVRQPDTADGNGRVLAEHGIGYNTPGTNEPGPFEHPRTIGVPGVQEGSPTKFDYNMPTRRTMTSTDKEAYKPRIPWRRQQRQRVWDKLKSERDYRQNKSKIKHRARLWYKRVRKNRQFLTKKEDRRNNPQKYKRRRVGEDGMNIEAYTPTSLSTRRRRQHGPARMKSHRNYIRNRAKARRRQHIWYQRNKNKPAFKRRQMMRRRHPQRFHLRPGAYVHAANIGFVYGPDMTIGQVDSVSTDAVVFSPVMGDGEDEPAVLTPAAFLHAVVFDSPDSMRMMFALLDEQVGIVAYDDLTVEDVEDIAEQYGVAPVNLVSDDPDYLSTMANTIVGAAMADWDESALSPQQDTMRFNPELDESFTRMTNRVASRWLRQAGELGLIERISPDDWERPIYDNRPERPVGPGQWTKTDPAPTHDPTPADFVPPNDVGFPASSGKVIPEHLKHASFMVPVQFFKGLRTPDDNSDLVVLRTIDRYGSILYLISWYDHDENDVGYTLGESTHNTDPEIDIAERIALANGAARDRRTSPQFLAWDSQTQASKVGKQIIQAILDYRRSQSKAAASSRYLR